MEIDRTLPQSPAPGTEGHKRGGSRGRLSPATPDPIGPAQRSILAKLAPSRGRSPSPVEFRNLSPARCFSSQRGRQAERTSQPQKQKHSHSKCCKSHKDEAANSKKKLSYLRSEFISLKNEVEGIRDAKDSVIKTLQQEITQLKNTCSQANNEEEILKLKENNKENEAALHKQINQLKQSKRDALIEAEDILQDKLNKIKKENSNHLDDEIFKATDKLTEELTTAQEEIKNLQKTNSEALGIQNNLQQELSQATEEMKASQRTCDSLQEDIDNLQIKHKEDIDEVRNENQEVIDDMNSRISELEKDVAKEGGKAGELEIELSETRNAVSESETRIQGYKDDLIAKDEQIANTESTVDSLHQEHSQQIQNLRSNHDTEITSLQQSLTSVSSQLTVMRSSLEREQHNVTELKEKLSDKEGSLTALEEEVNVTHVCLSFLIHN